MRFEDKLRFLKENYSGLFYLERGKVREELSNQQPLFCCCGQLATGLHELTCRRFQDKVDRETVKRFSSLIKEHNHE